MAPSGSFCDVLAAEFNRVLVVGGKLIMTDLYARNTARIADGQLPPGSCFAGMRTQTALVAELADNGFTVEQWEDHSPKLTDYVARMIMADGPLPAFWDCGCGSSDSELGYEAVRRLRPGYFLLVARKTRELIDKG